MMMTMYFENITLLPMIIIMFLNFNSIIAHKNGISKREITKCGDMKFIVDQHNKLRKLEGSSNMKKMKWSARLASMADRYALKCVWEHGDLELDEGHDLPYKEVGQNLYTSKGESINYEFIISKWYEEKMFFNFTARTCATGKLCGHYTQMVWGNSSDIGCSYRRCKELIEPNVQSLKDYDYVVCYYGPSGNYRQLPIYEKGIACSSCPEEFKICDNGLCSSGPGYGDINEDNCINGCSKFKLNLILNIVSVIILVNI